MHGYVRSCACVSLECDHSEILNKLYNNLDNNNPLIKHDSEVYYFVLYINEDIIVLLGLIKFETCKSDCVVNPCS